MLFITKILGNTIHSKLLSKFNNDKVYITIEKYYPKRTLQSNKYYWAILNNVLQVVADEIGYDNKDELHSDFKQMFLSYNSINKITGEEVTKTKSTAELSTMEFSKYVESVIKFCSEKLGIVIKSPEEYYEN